jgi:hypothetical protein
MGKTNPTYRDQLDALEDEYQPFRRALRRQYKADYDQLFERGRQFADAAGVWNPIEVERAFLISVLLSQERELRKLREEVCEP